MRIQIVKQMPPGLFKIQMEVSDRSTVATVLKKACLEVEPGWSVSVWGEIKELTYPLKEGDRIEISAPLVADPKTARRIRQARQESAKRNDSHTL